MLASKRESVRGKAEMHREGKNQVRVHARSTVERYARVDSHHEVTRLLIQRVRNRAWWAALAPLFWKVVDERCYLGPTSSHSDALNSLHALVFVAVRLCYSL
jgi:hypothetical protein